ncbi:MAG: hypothetical protein EXS37_19465 [Opitutus sp.]|nr:hypothetical protein [Opitutus sp.]
MAFTYTTRRGAKYYLHTGPKRGGGIQHYISTKPKGPVAEALPDGFEIYETVNGLAFLRRKKPSLIRDDELACLRRELGEKRGQKLYELEVTGDVIIVHEAENMHSDLAGYLSLRPGVDLMAVARQFAQYMPVMRFVLQDKTARMFEPERYCFRGSVDDWISIGAPDTIEPLAAKFLPHLGRDSFYELY